MESIDPKVMAAISAAIGAYLEEEAAAAMAAQAFRWLSTDHRSHCSRVIECSSAPVSAHDIMEGRMP